MVVFLQELEIKSVSDLTLEDVCDLSQTFFCVGYGFVISVDISNFFSDQIKNTLLERLILFVTDVE